MARWLTLTDVYEQQRPPALLCDLSTCGFACKAQGKVKRWLVHPRGRQALTGKEPCPTHVTHGAFYPLSLELHHHTSQPPQPPSQPLPTQPVPGMMVWPTTMRDTPMRLSTSRTARHNCGHTGAGEGSTELKQRGSGRAPNPHVCWLANAPCTAGPCAVLPLYCPYLVVGYRHVVPAPDGPLAAQHRACRHVVCDDAAEEGRPQCVHPP